MTWNIHPGEILREEFLKPLGLSARKLAKLLAVPAPRINDILLERRGVSAETALRLAHYFDTTPKFWLNMQISYELKKAEEEIKVGMVQKRPILVNTGHDNFFPKNINF